MKLDHKESTTDRSLLRRWAFATAEPVSSYLPPYTEFVPADVRIWWSARAEQPEEKHSLHVYAWPAERDNHLSAHWTNGHNRDPLPEWIRELSEVVHNDLITNATTLKTGGEDLWAYSRDSVWTLEDAPSIPSSRNPNESFVPAELSIWHTVHVGGPSQDRHRITAYPGDRKRGPRVYADWGGGVGWDRSPRYDENLPAWIRELAVDQHEQLVAFAETSEQERVRR